MALTPGSRLGPYEIVALLGAGGMGEVYRARDVRLDRDVAVKVIAGTRADAAHLQRFEQEARAVAALSHPNVVALFDVGGSDPPYLVTELLQGETLRARLGRGVLSLVEALDVARQLVAGLSAAHGQAIVHRDLKPENVFLTRDGVVKILDFGLAKSSALAGLSDEDVTRAPVTMHGTVLGTVGYMAPEQVRGGNADHRSDLFAFGAILYEMVQGRRAFEGSSPADTMSAILREQPPALTSDGAMPSGVSRVIRRCLEKDPGLRFQSASDLAVDLRGLASTPQADTTTTDSLAVLPFTNAGGPDAEYLSEGIAESLTNAFTQIARLQVVPRSVVARYKGKDVDPRIVGRELGARMLLSGKVVERSGRLSVQVELIDAAANKQLWGDRLHRPLADIFEVEEEITRQIVDKLRVRLSGEEKKQLARRYTEDSEAYQLYLKSRYHFLKRTPDGLEKGIHYCELAIERDPDFALAYAALTDCCLVMSSVTQSEPKPYRARAKTAATRAVESDPMLAEAHNSLAYSRACCDWDWTGAETSFQRALELSPTSWITHDWYALTLSSQGRAAEAIEENRRAQALQPLSVVLHHHAAWIHFLARRYDDAIEWGRKTLELDAGFGWAYLWMGLATEQKSGPEDALTMLKTASELTGGLGLAVTSLVHALAAGGHRDEAAEALRSLEQPSSPRYVEPYGIALVYAALGERDKAFAALERAYDDVSTWSTLFLKSDPRLDSLRSDRRFADLLHRMRLDRPPVIPGSAAERIL